MVIDSIIVAIDTIVAIDAIVILILNIVVVQKFFGMEVLSFALGETAILNGSLRASMIAAETTDAILMPVRSGRFILRFRMIRGFRGGFHLDVVKGTDHGAFSASNTICIGVEGFVAHKEGVEAPPKNQTLCPGESTWDGLESSLP